LPNDQRKAVILGSTSGIGKEMALWLAAQGWRVGITGRRENLLHDLNSLNSDAFVSRVIDINDRDALLDGLEKLANLLDGIDMMVISSGVGFFNPDLDDPIELKTIETNVTGFTVAADWGYRYFKQRGHGRLAAITSVAGLIGEAEAPAYSASKAYQISYLDGLRKRAGKDMPDVSITDIRPGSVRTDMMKGDGHFWISSPERAADIACRAILKGKSVQYVTPPLAFDRPSPEIVWPVSMINRQTVKRQKLATPTKMCYNVLLK